MALVPLCNRSGIVVGEAIVDDTDADALRQFRWRMLRGGRNRTAYAVSFARPGGEGGKPHIVYLHHAILGRPLGGLVIDHINGNGLDNRRSNLRICSRQENSRNCRGRGRLGFKGVAACRGRFAARIWIDGRNRSLGTYDSAAEAGAAYEAAARLYFGEFATTRGV